MKEQNSFAGKPMFRGNVVSTKEVNTFFRQWIVVIIISIQILVFNEIIFSRLSWDSQHLRRLVWHRRRHGGHVIQLCYINNERLREESKSEIVSFGGTCAACCVWYNCCACCTAVITQPARYSLWTPVCFVLSIRVIRKWDLNRRRCPCQWRWVFIDKETAG